VYAFEPLPRNIEYLRKHLKLNSVSNAELLELAVCDVVGIASFQEADNSSMGHLGGGGSTRVRTATLDSLLLQEKILPPSLIKIDIEGAELPLGDMNARILSLEPAKTQVKSSPVLGPVSEFRNSRRVPRSKTFVPNPATVGVGKVF
jgi:hypothetical protein